MDVDSIHILAADDTGAERTFWTIEECPLSMECSPQSWQRASVRSYEGIEQCRTKLLQHLCNSRHHQMSEADALSFTTCAVIEVFQETAEMREAVRVEQSANANKGRDGGGGGGGKGNGGGKGKSNDKHGKGKKRSRNGNDGGHDGGGAPPPGDGGGGNSNRIESRLRELERLQQQQANRDGPKQPVSFPPPHLLPPAPHLFAGGGGGGCGVGGGGGYPGLTGPIGVGGGGGYPGLTGPIGGGGGPPGLGACGALISGGKTLQEDVALQEQVVLIKKSTVMKLLDSLQKAHSSVVQARRLAQQAGARATELGVAFSTTSCSYQEEADIIDASRSQLIEALSRS